MREKTFLRRFEGSPLTRAKRKGMLRNVCVALGNWGAAEAVPVLDRALDDDQPLVRVHAAWALGRVGSDSARRALEARRRQESETAVTEEIDRALDAS